MKNDISTPNALAAALAKCSQIGRQLLGYSFIYNLLVLILSLYSLQVLDRVLSSASLDTLFYLTVLAFGVVVFLTGLSILRSYLLIRASDWLDRALTKVFLNCTFEAASKHTLGSGAEYLRDLTTFRQFISGNGIVSLFDAPWAILFIIGVFFINPILGLVVLFGGIVLFVLTIINELATKKLLGEANGQQSKNMAQIEKSVLHCDTMRAMNMEPTLSHLWMPQHKQVIKLQNVASRRSAIILSVSRSFRMLLQVIIMGAGSWLVLLHDTTMGGVIAISILAGRALAPFEQSIGIWNSFTSARGAYARLQKALASYPPVAAAPKLPPAEGKIEVQGLCYTAGSPPKTILNQINFQLAPGSSMAIIGPSASGKSTLLKLLAGVYAPSAGHARLDGADLIHWNREQLGAAMGYMSQEVGMFAGTIAQNIARMQDNASDESVIKAATASGAHPMILQLSKGYQTEIGHGGWLLSSGQRQRVGLARAYFGDPKLMLLDEPDANLDREGEAAFLHAVQQAKAMRMTQIIVTHKPNILQYMDYILVLNAGTQLDFGPTPIIMQKLMQSQRIVTPVQPVKTDPQP